MSSASPTPIELLEFAQKLLTEIRKNKDWDRLILVQTLLNDGIEGTREFMDSVVALIDV